MKRIFILLSLLLPAVMVLSCRNEAAPAAPAEAEQPVRHDSATQAGLRVALLPTLDCLPFLYADEAGIYDSLGLSVELRTFEAQADCDTALLGTWADVSASDLVTVRLQRRRGHPVSVVAATDGRWSLVVSRLLRVRRLSQAKERMVAVARQSYADYLTTEALQGEGMGYDDVFRPQINALRLRLDMLYNDQVDLAVLPEPQVSAARALGHRVIYTGRVPMGCIAVGDSVLADTVRAARVGLLLRGYDEAVARLNKGGKGAALPLLRRVYELSPAAVDSLRWPKFSPLHAPDGESVDRAVQYLREQGLLRSDEGAGNMVNKRFLQ